jgi:hypothetical protein
MMIWRRWATFGVFTLAVSLNPGRAAAQLATTGGSSSGFAGANSSGGYSASVPLDLPGARGGLPVPVQIAYGERGVGAAGAGWDVPLSYIRRDTTVLRRRPIGTANVAPQGREQVSLVLEGRRFDLVRRATEWVARRDAPDLRVRQQGDGTWVMYDGQGRTYLFTATSAALAGAGMWLLQDVSGAGGSKVHLDYDITTSTVRGSAAVSIDLIRASYNPHPTTAGCYKTVVELLYGGNAAAPLSVSTLGTTLLVRQRVLGTIDLSSKETCGAAGVRLRQYQFVYQPDLDTQLPRLQSVGLQGRVGTPEGSTLITIASYAYGTASGNALQYQQTQHTGLANLGHTISSPAARPGFGTGFSTDQSLIDMTGDGRPDYVSYSPGSLSVRRNTSAVNAVFFSSDAALSDNVLSPRALTTSTSLSGFDDRWGQPTAGGPQLRQSVEAAHRCQRGWAHRYRRCR